MSIRLPLKTILDVDDASDVGAGSVGGAIMHTFRIPQDTDNVVVKFTASTVGGGVSAVFQTSDDGGTTYYDIARTSIVSNATNATAQWLSIPTIGPGIRTTTNGVSSVASGNATVSVLGATGSAQSLQLPQLAVTGLPILGQHNRIAVILTGNLTANALSRTEVKVNNQSATA